MEVVNVLTEHGASVLVQSKRNNQTPRALLKAQSRPVPETRKAHDLRQHLTAHVLLPQQGAV